MANLTVLSYNVWGAVGSSNTRFRHIAQYLNAAARELNVDVIVLNEVLWGSQYDVFANEMRDYMPINDPFHDKNFPLVRIGGNGVMVMLNVNKGLRIGEVTNHTFQRAVSFDRLASKGFTHVPITKNGVECNLFATHLQAKYAYNILGQFKMQSWSEEERETIRAQLNQMVSRGRRLPNSFYVGNMNTDDVHLFQSMGLHAAVCRGLCGTYFGDGEGKEQHLDHILTHEPQPNRLRMLYSKELKTLSDHFPVVMQLHFPRQYT